jgi:hypothetical protein
MKTKYPACGFEHKNEPIPILTDATICEAWAHLYLLTRRLPTREQFEAMQREKFLPEYGGNGWRVWKIGYGDCGWGLTTTGQKLRKELKRRWKMLKLTNFNPSMEDLAGKCCPSQICGGEMKAVKINKTNDFILKCDTCGIECATVKEYFKKVKVSATETCWMSKRESSDILNL